MKLLTREWVGKAEEDWIMALKGYRARKQPCYNAACFHAQQCAEKHIKACLQELRVAFPKTHDLEELLDLVTPKEPSWEMLRPLLQLLKGCAVDFRYPGDDATKEVARQALAAAKQIRSVTRETLRLPE